MHFAFPQSPDDLQKAARICLRTRKIARVVWRSLWGYREPLTVSLLKQKLQIQAPEEALFNVIHRFSVEFWGSNRIPDLRRTI